jgi:hypothetical protein
LVDRARGRDRPGRPVWSDGKAIGDEVEHLAPVARAPWQRSRVVGVGVGVDAPAHPIGGMTICAVERRRAAYDHELQEVEERWRSAASPASAHPGIREIAMIGAVEFSRTSRSYRWRASCA